MIVMLGFDVTILILDKIKTIDVCLPRCPKSGGGGMIGGSWVCEYENIVFPIFFITYRINNGKANIYSQFDILTINNLGNSKH